MQRDSFIFYRSFYEAINDLPEKNQLKVYKAICELSLNFEEIDLSGLSSTIFKLIKPQLEANNKRYKNGLKGKDFGSLGGRPLKPQDKPQKNPKKTPNINVNDNDNVNVNDNDIYIADEKHKNNKKEKYGTYGRIKLTINEYLKLRDEYGEDFIKNQIELLDEYIESNNNKNKYTNFNLVLRKSIRENWFKDKTEKKGKQSAVDCLIEMYGK